jgi:hypothetical protein
MSKIIEMPGETGGTKEANDFAKQNILETLGRQQQQWVQYFEVLIKGLAHDEHCQYCKGPDGKGRGYVAINYVTPPKGKGVAQGYYQLQFCRCAAIPQGMDPNVMYMWMQQIDNSVNATSQYIFRHTFYGFWVWTGVTVWRWITDAVIAALEWLAKVTEPKKPAAAAPDAEQLPEEKMFIGGAGDPADGIAGKPTIIMPPGTIPPGTL